MLAVRTVNFVRIDLVKESLNVSDDGRAVMLLPGAVRLAVQVEEPSAVEVDDLEQVRPRFKRLEVLRVLDRYNLNEHSLIGSEESLMETLAFREIDQELSP